MILEENPWDRSNLNNLNCQEVKMLDEIFWNVCYTNIVWHAFEVKGRYHMGWLTWIIESEFGKFLWI